jgi:hypothetical protein
MKRIQTSIQILDYKGLEFISVAVEIRHFQKIESHIFISISFSMHVVFWILSFIKKGYLSDFNLYAKMKRRENNILKRQLLRP